MDYASLREEGIRQLERMAGGQWTDFNAHDPGITILEQLCYALSDIGYRTAHPILDLLAEGGSDPYESLHGPAEILGSCPVTPADLRRLVLDVEGVRNAWIVPLQADTLPLYYHPGRGELSLSEQPAPSEPVAIKGLYRVAIDAAELMGTRVRIEVARRLHENRGLCEDFVEIKVLDLQMVTVDASVEIGPGEDAEVVHAAILRRLADAVSPTVPFATLEELLRAGRPLDEIFEGPPLKHGFILDEALERTQRREAINTSDVVRAIMDVSGVRAVSSVSLAAGGAQPEQWSLAIPEGTVARLDDKRSRIRLRRAGKVVFPRSQPAGLPTAAPPVTPTAAPAAVGSPPRAPGRDRGVAKYMSVQQQFPAVYGIGEMGLPSTATPARRAQAKQLQAYLMIFDQLMANHLAQLAHVKDLLALDGDETHTYFTQTIEGPGLGVAAIRKRTDERAVLYQSLGSIEDVDQERKGRFLSHLLARFGEVIDDHGTSSLAELTRSRQAFLRRAPRLGGARGTGFNYFRPPGEDNRSGLEERVRLKLGLTVEEACVVVEHILLRPVEGDREQQSPLLAAVKYKDPYSLQLTFVFKDGVGRFDDKDGGGLRALAEETVRAETPAHIAPHLLWLKDPAFETFVAAHEAWLSRRRTYLEGLGL